MFGNNKVKQQNKEMNNNNLSANTIQNGTKIEGHINSSGSIRIDGVLKGSLTTQAKLVVGKTGVIFGDIICQNISIEGKVEGKVTVQGLLYLKNGGTILGDIFTDKLVVEEGAIFNGKLEMTESTSMQKKISNKNVSHKKAV